MMLMLCPICAGEFQPRLALCPSCDCQLVPSNIVAGSASPEVEHPKRGVEFVELCRPRLYPVAMLIKQTLEHHEVPVMIQGGNALSVLPHLAFGGELRVMVDKQQLEFARTLYHAYFESDDETDFIHD